MYEIVVRATEQGFQALCPQIPGVGGSGDTAGAALDAAIAALNQWLVQRGEPMPPLDAVRASFQRSWRA